MKNIIAPNSRSLRSAMQIVENAGQIKATKKVGWEMQRTVPVSLRNDRVIAEIAANRAARVDAARAKSIPSGIVCRKVAGNQIQIIGHGVTVPNFQAAKDFAVSIGRAWVKMGAIHANVG